MSAPLFCYYGDDFTGSTDALEALAANGVPSVLFLDPPSREALAAFPECAAIGVAGESRSRDPEWMSAHLPAALERLMQCGAPICQYKVCSTFDSSPATGSIGRALEIGRRVFNSSFVPVAVAAPHLGRYVLFGNLFAAGGGAVHRIDRHPTMRHHPVTPMDEADLRLHLGRQTGSKIALLDLLTLRSGCAEAKLEQLVAQGAVAVVFDGLDDQTLAETGRLVSKQPFAVGSSGLTQALIRHWRSAGLVPSIFTPEKTRSCDRLIVISGSCSPVTEEQIRWATAHGFAGFRMGAENGALEALADGRSVVIYSALGPRDYSAGLRGEELGRAMATCCEGCCSNPAFGGRSSPVAIRPPGRCAV